MLFVARFSNLTVMIRPALVKRGENELGQIAEYVERPALDVDFVPMAMTEAQRIIAVRMFTTVNPKAPWGSVPYEIDGTMGQEFGDLIMDVERYAGYNPAFNLSKYDTRTDVPYEAQKCYTEDERSALKMFIEDRLMGMPEFGREYLRLDESLPKPWPAYPMETGPGIAAKIVAASRDFGIDMDQVVEYEKTQDKPREYVITALEAEIAKTRASEAERAALGAIVS